MSSANEQTGPMTGVTQYGGRRVTALAVTLGLAAVSWVVAVGQMRGMDLGIATPLGPFPFFIVAWAWMMAAMMLPGTAAVFWTGIGVNLRLRDVASFVGSYLGVWTLVGVAVYALYRPHGSFAAGGVVVLAGIYEFTPFKRLFRRHCRDSVHSGLAFGLYCVGSSIGLMLVMVAVGVMNVAWMAVITVLTLAQKVLRTRAAIDIPVGLAMVALGILILAAPSSVPGLTPPMTSGGADHSMHEQ